MVAAAIQEASTRRQIVAAQSIIRAASARSRSCGQLKSAYVARLDVAQQEPGLAQAQAQLPPLTASSSRPAI